MKISAGAGFAAGAAFSLLLAGGTAYAATGGTFILGRANAASTVTTLSNSAGTPLSLGAKAGTAPLAVNSEVKVGHLNSDRLDGLDSLSFLRSTGKAADASKLDGVDSTGFALANGGVGRAFGGDGYAIDFDGDTVNDSLEADADCPIGSKAVGGGFYSETGAPVLMSAAYPDGTGWFVVFADPNGTLSPLSVTAVASCYNARGAVTQPLALKRAYSVRGAR